MVCGPDDCIHLGADKRICDNNAAFLTIIGAETQREYAVDLTGSHCLQCIFCGAICFCFKGNLSVFLAGFTKRKVISQCSGQNFRFIIKITEWQEVITISHPDRPMIGEPILFLGCEKTVYT